MMSQRIRERALVLVKAFPQPSQKYEETVCCAGIDLSGNFLRIYPVRYRRLRSDQQFSRWDVIEFEAERPTDDWRPESRHVSEDTIRIVQRCGQVDEEQRVRLWAPHVAESLTALRKLNVETERSLGIVRPDPGSVRFKARKLDTSAESDRALQDTFRQFSLIEDGPLTKLVVTHEFSYQFRSGGHPHTMKIHDWEVQAACFNFKRKYGDAWLERLTHKYQVDIPSGNLHLVMGTMKGHPRTFIIIGLLRTQADPNAVAAQAALI